MLVFPNAKINFGLYVVALRRDGFHNIESVLWPVPWHDILEIVPSADGRFSFRQTGLELTTPASGNLVVKAWEQMQQAFDLPMVHIHLHKLIPPGSGLGGGSSDAAHTITALNDLFSLGLRSRRMQKLAANIGSDCPFFIDGKPHFVAGTGTLLSETQVDLKGLHIGIVKPDIQISSARAYQEITPSPAPNNWENPGKNPEKWEENVFNQFETYVFREYPGIRAIKDDMTSLKAVYTSLSGSGSAVYGLFQQKPNMAQWFPQFVTWQGQL
ncbi:MAG: 4-(cytidine 5'-diphospho)-2-C-methyl-D-erythritol kinase [Bacteroidales bacterium]